MATKFKELFSSVVPFGESDRAYDTLVLDGSISYARAVQLFGDYINAGLKPEDCKKVRVEDIRMGWVRFGWQPCEQGDEPTLGWSFCQLSKSGAQIVMYWDVPN